MKRSSRGDGEIESLLCLMLLSREGETESTTRVFECKTCSRQFSSFQALGGHRASHKKLRLMGEVLNDQTTFQRSVMKPKTHECSICGLEFATGQALGGHTKRHRGRSSMFEGLLSSSRSLSVVSKVPVVKRSNSKRVLCLDLNLTPLENDLELLFGKMVPKVN